MKRFSVERLVYNGSDSTDDWKVTAIGHSKLKLANVRCVQISSMHEYEAGCKLHDRCLGHMGMTRSGVMLPIQSLCVHNVNVSNIVFKAVEVALREQNAFGAKRCNDILLASMKRKTGRMRKGVLNCHVDGSLRMVVTPQWAFPRNVVAIPCYLKDKWLVCRLDPTTRRYVSLPVEDGDHAVVVRPPSLSAQSVQPMVIRYWNNTCMGVSPDIIKSFHGDYDGDEMHVNPVYSKKALGECREWDNTPNEVIDKANAMYRRLGMKELCPSQGSYMLHTTMSFTQIKHGSPQLMMAEEARLKQDHIVAIRKRLCDRSSIHRSFDSESVRGMADINRRYLTQPVIGDMSRIAKIVASCVSQDSGGWIGVWGENGFQRILLHSMDPCAGNAAVRGISTICASAQQVALDAHRLSQDMSPLHDMISDLIVGSEYTLVVFSPKHTLPESEFRNGDVKWKYNSADACYVICRARWSHLRNSAHIIAAYNPVVISKVQPNRRIDVCSRGIKLICIYYSIRLSSHEAISLSVLYTYLPHLHALPITTRDGMYARRLQWTETTMARHYSGLMRVVNSTDIVPCPITTVSACLIAANFSRAPPQV